MDFGQMYLIGCLITGIASIVAFIQGFKILQEQETAKWKEEWKHQIETIER